MAEKQEEIEKGVDLVGATAIEDKLQVNVGMITFEKADSEP